jgi:YegS/Rv2252/BmrU family lipid kinase
MAIPYKRIHIVINPASGHDEPILNVLNRVFVKHGVEWSESVTHKYGDATEQARAAIEAGVDLVAGYGGDGTQHEIANAILGTGATMGILPGGTGNGFAREMGIPGRLEPAVELLCTSHNTRTIDVAKVGENFFIQRLYVGIEPEQQTSREMKDRYGVFAYAVSMVQRSRTVKPVDYQVTIDGRSGTFRAIKTYVINSGMMGTGLSVTHGYAIDDGLLDAFFVDTENLRTISGAVDRFLNLETSAASEHIIQCKTISIDTDPDQPVWTDGEYTGRTPIEIEVVPAALRIAVA